MAAFQAVDPGSIPGMRIKDKTTFVFSSLTQLVTGNGLSPFLGRFDPCSEYLNLNFVR